MIHSKITLFQNKRTRPRIRPRRTALDWTLDLITLDLLLATCAYAVWQYPSLPLMNGTGVDGSGKAIQTGASWTIFLMPATAILLCVILRTMQHFPWIANTLIAITEQNAERQYQLISRLLGWIGLIIAGSFALMTIEQIQQAQGTSGIGAFGPALMLLQPIVIAWYLIRSFQAG
ncbi:MAG: hypothetical protein CBC35_06065 [Planctomycetes bacterium TMED75]|nr:hypothetical protein [Planctomycetaceae bacterium]OUU93181.1 MAG: hypothetical protein CBC35_06065 [Planctomycetes bacterium TMED75]